MMTLIVIFVLLLSALVSAADDTTTPSPDMTTVNIKCGTDANPVTVRVHHVKGYDKKLYLESFDERILHVSSNADAWRSDDDGQSFKQMFPNGLPNNLNASYISVRTLNSPSNLLVNEFHRGQFYYDRKWYVLASDDGGKTFDEILLGDTNRTLVLKRGRVHPSRPKALLAYMYGGVYRDEKYVPTRAYTFFVSSDSLRSKKVVASCVMSGMQWSADGNYVVYLRSRESEDFPHLCDPKSAEWEEPGLFKPISERAKSKGELRDHSCKRRCKLARRSITFADNGEIVVGEETVLVDRVDSMGTLREYASRDQRAYVARGFENDLKTSKLWFSLDGVEWREAKFPTPMHRYTPLFVEEDSMAVASVDCRDDASEAVGEVYVMDSNDRHSSMIRVHDRAVLGYVGNGGLDLWTETLERFESLRGTMFMQVYDTEAGDSRVIDRDCWRTMRTSDYGAQWRELSSVIGTGGENLVRQCNADRSSERCSLQLNIDPQAANGHGSDGISARADAPGIALATGRVDECGESPSSAVQETADSTFLTLDGGETWQEVLREKCVHVVGANADYLLLMPSLRAWEAKSRGDSTGVRAAFTYSLDRGVTWEQCDFSSAFAGLQDGFFLSRAWHEDDRQRFWFSGSTADTDESVLVSVNMGAANTKACADADIELWSPSSGCVLGERVQFRRGALGKVCHVPDAPKSASDDGGDGGEAKSAEACDCVEEDFECSFCHERVDNTCRTVRSGACDVYFREMDEAGECVDAWSRVPNNRCNTSSELARERLLCMQGNEGPLGKGGSGVVVVLFSGLFCLFSICLCACIVRATRRPAFIYNRFAALRTAARNASSGTFAPLSNGDAPSSRPKSSKKAKKEQSTSLLDDDELAV